MKNGFWFIAAVAAVALAWLLRSPYMAFALYVFLLLVALALSLWHGLRTTPLPRPQGLQNHLRMP